MRCAHLHSPNSFWAGMLMAGLLVSAPDNLARVERLRQLVNQRLRGRYVLQQRYEGQCTPYRMERVVRWNMPRLIEIAYERMSRHGRARQGLLVELTAGYESSYGTVLQTDLTCEICRALFLAYGPDDPPAGP